MQHSLRILIITHLIMLPMWLNIPNNLISLICPFEMFQESSGSNLKVKRTSFRVWLGGSLRILDIGQIRFKVTVKKYFLHLTKAIVKDFKDTIHKFTTGYLKGKELYNLLSETDQYPARKFCSLKGERRPNL